MGSIGFTEWIEELEGLIDSAILRKNIIGGFTHSGIFPINRDLITSSLPLKCPTFLNAKTHKSSICDLGNKVITDHLFLDTWIPHQKVNNTNNETKETDEIINEDEGDVNGEEEEGIFLCS